MSLGKRDNDHKKAWQANFPNGKKDRSDWKSLLSLGSNEVFFASFIVFVFCEVGMPWTKVNERVLLCEGYIEQKLVRSTKHVYKERILAKHKEASK
jgi:hypothetical protein